MNAAAGGAKGQAPVGGNAGAHAPLSSGQRTATIVWSPMEILVVAPCFLNKICVPFLMLAPSRHAGGTFSGSKASRNFLSCADEAPIFASRRRRIWRYSW